MFNPLRIAIPVVLLSLVSCADRPMSKQGTYFGGEIVNPKDKAVFLSKGGKIIDTLKLDKNNFFIHKFEAFEPGLYTFIHNENQLVYIEPGDSIMLRVNTFEFDESLAYTGKGAEKNNFIINMFLVNEREDNSLPEMYQLSSSKFEKALDSMRTARLQQFTHYTQKYEFSKEFEEVAKASLDYFYFTKKELYPFGHYGSNHLKNMESLPASFYDHRKEVNFGDDRIATYYPYYRYLNAYLDNVSYSTYMKRAKFDRNSKWHIEAKMELADSIITHEGLKNKLMYYATRRFLINASEVENNQEIVDNFLALNTDKEDHKLIKNLMQYCNDMVPGKPIPNQIVVTSDGTLKDLHGLVSRPTVFYFWTTESAGHSKRIHRRASELKDKFPDFDFFGISVDDNHEKWLQTLKTRGYNSAHEYRFNDIKAAEERLVLSWANKAILVDKRGNIVKNNTNLFVGNFEGQLLSYLNQ